MFLADYTSENDAETDNCSSISTVFDVSRKPGEYAGNRQ